MSTLQILPSTDQMYQAIVDRDAQWEGIFVIGVKTTGIFCRPGCKAKTPRRENIEFFPSAEAAQAAGYRPCLRCHPTQLSGQPPEWLAPLLAEVAADPRRRWANADLEAQGLSPTRVRRWFQQHYRMTFQAYVRTRRIGLAVSQLRAGDDVTTTALDSGFESLSGFRETLQTWLGQTPTAARQQEPIFVERILTPLGPMLAAANDKGLCLLEFADRKMLPQQFKRLARLYGSSILPGRHPVLEATADQLAQYFAATRQRFDVPLRCDGTPFQMEVWNLLQQIPYGQTRSYQQLAASLGRPGASRAVGRTNGDNRLAIVIPCHRVVRSDGHLCGYAGGLWRKRWLLTHEQTAVS